MGDVADIAALALLPPVGPLGEEDSLMNRIQLPFRDDAPGQVKAPQDLGQVLRQAGEGRLLPDLIDAVVPLGDAPRDGGKGIAVAPQGDGGAQHVLKALPLQKGGDGLGHGFLTALHMAVIRADLITGAAQVVMEGILDAVPDLALAAAGAGQKNGRRSSLRSLYAFRMVVGHLRGKSGRMPDRG